MATFYSMNSKGEKRVDTISANELKIPHAEKLNRILPQSYDLSLVVAKKICDEEMFCDNYLYIQALYRKGLDQYFLKELGLKKYDELLTSSKLRFITRGKEHQNVYQESSTLAFNYIYLHNNLYVERLDEKMVNFLQNRINNHQLDVDAELLQVVKETYPAVIKVFPDKKSPVKVLYSLDGKKLAWPNAVIFEIGHQSEFDRNGNYVSRENEINKNKYLQEKLIPQMESELSKKLNLPVSVFVER